MRTLYRSLASPGMRRSRACRPHQPQENAHDRSPTATRHPLLAAGALAIAGCGMMNEVQRRHDACRSRAQNEVPPNTSPGSGTGKVELDGNVIKWTITYSGTTGPVTAGHFHGPAAARRERRRRRAVRRPAGQPDHRLGHADAGAGRPGQARPLVHQPAHRRQPGRRAARPGQVTPATSDRTPIRAQRDPRSRRGAAGQADRGAFAFSSSRRRSTRRCTLPVVVIGSASMNSISFGYS